MTVPRFATPRTPSRKTLGTAARKIANELGRELMPWQEEFLDLAFEQNDDDTFAYRELTLLTPRQSGKTFCLLIFILCRALSYRNQRIKYTSQTLADGRKQMCNNWIPELERSSLAPYLKCRLANGSESITFANGSELTLVASTMKAGHGSTNDVCILDEAFAWQDDRMQQALVPSMATRKSPQFLVVSTAGTPHGSPYLLNRVEQGRKLAEAGLTETAAYVEYSAPEDADPSLPETWRSANPALDFTISEDAIRAEHGSMDLAEFKRARLNQWTTTIVEPVVPLAQWNALADSRTTPGDSIVLAFDVSPDRARSAIACAGKRDDGRFHVEMIDNDAGTEWLPGRLAELVEKHEPAAVYCDPVGPSGSLLPALKELDIEPTLIGARELAQACGSWYDLVTQGRLVHLGQPELLSAVDGATRRALGDAWAWSRKSSSVDISPLVAITIALWGCQNIEPAGVGVWSLSEIVEDLQRVGRLPGGLSPNAPPPPSMRPQHQNFLIGRKDEVGFMPPPFNPQP